MASFGSVVGLPLRSSAQPSGIFSPFCIASMILPRTTVVSARSITSGSPFFRGNAKATGSVPNRAFLPPQAGIAAGELVNATPTMPAAATGSRWMPSTPTCELLVMPAKPMPLRRARWITSSIAQALDS